MKREKLPSVVYIICNGRNIEKCEVIRETKDLITLKILSTGQGTRLRRSKIYLTELDANKATHNQHKCEAKMY